MSVQHARAMNRPQTGVVVMKPGYFFTRDGVPRGSVITELDGETVTDIDQFVEAIRKAPKDEKLLLRFVVPGREFSSEIAQITINNRWFGHRFCERVDDARFWDCREMELPELQATQIDGVDAVPRYDDSLLNAVAPAMVRVDFSIPYSVDNVYARHFKGVGLVIDREQGLVAVDRNTVPIGLGDVDITFFGSQVLEGQVVFLHPRHNIALVQYDSSLLLDAEFEELTLADSDFAIPDDITMVAYREDGTFRPHQIDDMSRLTINFQPPGLPRFQQASLDVYNIPDVPTSLGGPLVDENGVVHAVYMSFAYEESREIRQREWAMPASVIAEALRQYRSQSPFYSLDIRMNYQPLSSARQLGLPDDWLRRYNALPAQQRRVLYVDQVIPGTDAEGKLYSGDVVLAIDNELVSELFQAERLAQHPAVSLLVLRRGEVMEIELAPSILDALGTDRMVSWAGAVFQESFDDIGYQKGVDFPGVYIASTEEGSPSLWDGLYRNRFVVAVDGVAIETLDDFLSEVNTRTQDEITRLTVVSMSGRKRIVTVQPEYNFWPTFEIKRTIAGWKRVNYLN